MSMKNRQTWEFAHKHCGRTWIICGAVLLPAAVAAMLFCLGADTDRVGNFGTAVIFGELAVLIASIIPTVVALRRNFDQYGRPVE